MNRQECMFEGSAEEFAGEVMKRLHVPLDEDSELQDEFVWAFEAVLELKRPTLQTVAEIINVELHRLVDYLDALHEADPGRVDRQEVDFVHRLLEHWHVNREAFMATVEPTARAAFRIAMRKAIGERDMRKIRHIVNIGMAPDNSLHMAAELECVAAVEMFIRKGFDPRVQNARGELAEDIAKQSGNNEIFSMLQKVRLKLDRTMQMKHLPKPRVNAL